MASASMRRARSSAAAKAELAVPSGFSTVAKGARSIAPPEKPRLVMSTSAATSSSGPSASVETSSAISATSLTARKLGPIQGSTPNACQIGSPVSDRADSALREMRSAIGAAPSRSPSAMDCFS